MFVHVRNDHTNGAISEDNAQGDFGLRLGTSAARFHFRFLTQSNIANFC